MAICFTQRRRERVVDCCDKFDFDTFNKVIFFVGLSGMSIFLIWLGCYSLLKEEKNVSNSVSAFTYASAIILLLVGVSGFLYQDEKYSQRNFPCIWKFFNTIFIVVVVLWCLIISIGYIVIGIILSKQGKSDKEYGTSVFWVIGATVSSILYGIPLLVRMRHLTIELYKKWKEKVEENRGNYSDENDCVNPNIQVNPNVVRGVKLKEEQIEEV